MPGPGQAQPPGHTVNMGVHRERAATVSNPEYYPGSLPAYTR